MKRTRTSNGNSPGGKDLLSSKKKRQALGLLLEELSRPEIDIPLISNHTSTVISQMQQRTMMAIPLIIRSLQKREEPLVLEIRSKPEVKEKSTTEKVKSKPGPVSVEVTVPVSVPGRVEEESSSQQQQQVVVEDDLFEQLEPFVSSLSDRKFIPEPLTIEEGLTVSVCDMKVLPYEVIPIMEDQSSDKDDDTSSATATITNQNENANGGGKHEQATEKQFEIIFADSTPRPNDNDNDSADSSDLAHRHHHIIHSTTETTGGTTSSEAAGTVNVPNSFPLFQLVHAGEVPEEMQREIERKIRLANPELDLNSITFKFKPPETVEIIANVNT